jgi:hypothetical protein
VHDYKFDITGTLTPCGPVAQPPPGFGIAVYAPGRGYVAAGGWLTYDQLDATNGFHTRISVADPFVRALCLVTSERVRVDCFALTTAADGGLVVGDRIPTNGTLVDRVIAPPNGMNKEPGCPTCMYE